MNTRAERRLLLGSLLILVSCNDGKGGRADAAATATPADPGAPAVDAGPVEGPDAGANAEAQLASYRGFLEQLALRLQIRRASCFGAPVELLTNQRPSAPTDGELLPSLRLGLQRFDETQARACIASIATASCERLAEILTRDGPTSPAAGEPACLAALVGTAAPGDSCLLAGDCHPREGFTCGGQGVCGICVARPRLKLGDTCSPGAGDCPVEAACRPGVGAAGDSSCQRLGQPNERCRAHTDCAPGLFCDRSGPDKSREGVCRPQASGTPCAAGWECLHLHACVGAGPQKAGACQVGKPIGEPCTVHAVTSYGVPLSDCAELLACVDLDGQGSRCVSGAKLGAACGPVGTNDARVWIACLEGRCNATETTKGICEPFRTSGAPCLNDDQCAFDLTCAIDGPAAGTCVPAPAPPKVGQSCRLLLPGSCGLDLYCAPPPGFDVLNPVVPENGVCAPRRLLGETCRPDFDPCEPLAKCTDGVCRRC
jgi:hypothetical protein